MTRLTQADLLELHALLLGSGSARAYRTGKHRTAVRRLYDHVVATLDAAPVPAELVKKLTASALMDAHVAAMAFARTRPCLTDLSSGLVMYGEHMRASIARLLSEGGAA